VAPHQGNVGGHVYGVGETGACSKTVVHTETSMFPQGVTSYSNGLDPRGFMELDVLAGPKQEVFT